MKAQSKVHRPAPLRTPAVDRGRPSGSARAALPVLGPLLAMTLLACGNSGATPGGPAGAPKPPSEVLSNLTVLPTPPGGLAIYTPIIKHIAPGADVTYCTYTEITADKDLFIHSTNGTESSMGHHVLLMTATSHEAPRTEVCSGQAMENLRQLIGGGGGEGTATNNAPLPPNVGMIIPKGSQFVVQTHWINTGTEPVDVQAMVVTEPGPDSADRIALGTLTVVDLGFKVPALSRASSSTECVFNEEHRLLMNIGHEHEWGTHVRAEVTHAAGSQPVVLFDRDFTPHDTFNPPQGVYPLAAPLVIAKGDTLKMSCDWDNTTSSPLTFPREMCVFFGYSMEPGDNRCINGNWVTTGTAAGDAGINVPGPPCAAEGAPGNENGVGKYCTRGGGECAGSQASICLSDYTVGALDFCTTLCADDSGCGSQARCVGAATSATKVCMPVACAPAAASGAADAGP
jgi:hypothetical protein